MKGGVSRKEGSERENEAGERGMLRQRYRKSFKKEGGAKIR